LVVLRSAGAQDPSLAGMWQQNTDPRLEVQAVAARSLVTKPGARPDLSAEHAADLLFGLLSPHLYLLSTAAEAGPKNAGSIGSTTSCTRRSDG
jgi:hypothetical protein